MKKVHNSVFWVTIGLLTLAFNPFANAQDDLYYDPAKDTPAPKPTVQNDGYDDNNNVTRRFDGDDDYYEDDDYAYEYSSRIRRFHQPSYGVDYYDPFFVDLYNYDPFYSPGTSIYVYNYNDYWSYRRWRRWQRWNAWNSFNYGYGYGWNTWGWNSAYYYNRPWYNPWVVNNYYYDPYWTCNGYNPYYQDHYYGNGWVNNHYYYNNNNHGGGGYSPQTYTGPRRGGSQVNPGYARIPDSKGRLNTAQGNIPTVERTTARPGRTASDIEGNATSGREKVTPSRSATPTTTGGRRPETTVTDPATPRTRTTESAPGRREIETAPARREEGYKPRRVEETPSRPQRTETPSRRNDNDGGYTPRRTESAPSSREESRPARRTEERSMDRPNRSDNNNRSGGFSQESRPSRSYDSGSSRSSGSNNGGSIRSSSGSSSGSKTSGRGGRN